MSESYDVAVIGSGPGGYVAGIKAAQAGLKTAVIERERLGGICLNWGCIPTKALLRSAELYEEFQHAEAHGFQVQGLDFDVKKIVKRSRKIADKMHRGVASLFKKYKVTPLSGSARFVDGQHMEVLGEGKTPLILSAKHAIIATGARPRALPLFSVDGKTVITYRQALELQHLPKKMLIVGAGAIGVEFAYYFNTFGVEVHLVELQAQLLPSEDEEIAAALRRQFVKKGIRCHLGSKIGDFQVRRGQVRAVLQGAEEQVFEGDMALIAVGMQANTEALGLEEAGVELEGGFVKTDAQLRTSNPEIFAIGDVAGRQLLAHKASAEAERAVETLLGHAPPPLDYAQIPACTYCRPQVASLGLTEQQCRQQGLDYRVGRFPYAASGKANAIAQLEGMIKLIFGEPHGQLLGAHMIGAETTELIAELGLAMRLEATWEEILATVHAHPTLSEGIFEAAGVAQGRSANL